MIQRTFVQHPLKRFRRVVILLLGSACITYSINSNADQAKADEALIQFVVHNIEFVLLHELAHVIITDRDVPVLGPLEPTADYLAISIAIQGGESPQGKVFLRDTLRDTARSFAISWRLATAANAPIPYWDTHSLSIQRYISIVCLLYGSETTTFAAMRGEIPASRANGCAAEYKMANKGFQWLLQHYPTEKTNVANVTYRYEKTTTPIQRSVLGEIRKLDLVENTVDDINRVLEFKAPIDVTLRTCAQANAFWTPARRELLICYELFDAFAQIYQSQTEDS